MVFVNLGSCFHLVAESSSTCNSYRCSHSPGKFRTITTPSDQFLSAYICWYLYAWPICFNVDRKNECRVGPLKLHFICQFLCQKRLLLCVLNEDIRNENNQMRMCIVHGLSPWSSCSFAAVEDVGIPQLGSFLQFLLKINRSLDAVQIRIL